MGMTGDLPAAGGNSPLFGLFQARLAVIVTRSAGSFATSGISQGKLHGRSAPLLVRKVT